LAIIVPEGLGVLSDIALRDFTLMVLIAVCLVIIGSGELLRVEVLCEPGSRALLLSSL